MVEQNFVFNQKNIVKDIPKIGGTKKLNLERISELNPDLIIANKEENERTDIEYLASKFPVWISDIFNLNDALEMIKAVGEITNMIEPSKKLVSDIENGFGMLQKSTNNQKVVYLIWQNPFISVGHDTFIHNMIEKMGWTNAFQGLNRYPELSIEAIKAIQPDRILLSSEPYPFQEKHIDFFKATFPNTQIQLVDGEFFSWYGSRLSLAPKYFKSIL